MIQKEDTGAEKSVVQPQAQDEELRKFDQTLRPPTLAEYIGQDEIKRNLDIFLKAAKKRGDALDHVLLHGPAGLGKTTLAYIITREMGSSLKITSGPALERQGDVAALLTNIQPHDVLFIDEIHRLRPAVEEVLYTAMEDYGIDIVLGKGPSARSVRLNIPKFTLIGATTKVSMLSSPLRDRFGAVFKFQFYEEEDIKQIILRSSSILGCELEQDAAQRLAKSSRRTPRIANRLLRRVRDFAEVHNHAKITREVVEESLKNLGVDEYGLDATDREILRLIIEKFSGGPVGLNTVSSALSEEEATIEDIYEPFLLQLGFLERTPRGRKVTMRAYRHLGLEDLADKQNAFL